MGPRIGICGAGRICSFHANGFVRSGCEIVAFADPRMEAAERAAEHYGAKAFADIDTMLANADLDIICIASPHDVHAPQAKAALTAGFDVFLDKPIAVTPQEGQQIVDLAERLGRRLGVNHNLLFHPAVELARQAMQDGAIGQPISASAWSTGWLVMGPHDFRLDCQRTGGGAWIDAGPHLVYTLADLLGPVETLVAIAAKTPSRLGGEDSVTAVLRAESGVVADLRISYAYVAPASDLEWPKGWLQGMEINGTEGAIRFTVTPSGRVETYRRGGKTWQTMATDLDFANSFDGAIEDFVSARQNGSTPRVTATDSVRLLSLMASSLRQ